MFGIRVVRGRHFDDRDTAGGMRVVMVDENFVRKFLKGMDPLRQRIAIEQIIPDCLPKDLRALVYRAGRLDLHLPLLQSVLPSNGQHLARAISAVLDLPAKRIGVVGLAFKENTDDLRESPVVSLLEQLIGKGRDVRVFDPHIQIEAIYGSNRNFILKMIPHIGRLMESDLNRLLGWADYVVVAQKQSGAITQQIQASGLPILDLVGGSLTTPALTTT